jgi:glycosyltransferase involved in cell wall biosynthesis
MNDPLISVITPAFNRSDLIVQTIKSVQAQTLVQWELIIVDDHSTDETPQVIRQFAGQDERIRFYIRQSVIKGPAACRNEGAGYAKSDLIVFLDSDDLLAPHCLEQRVAYMREHGANLDFAVFQTEVFKETPGDMGVCFNRLDYPDDIKHFLLNDNIWISTGPLWRRSTLLSLGGWNERIFGPDDWELSVRALLSGLRYQKIDRVDSYFRTDNVARGTISGRALEPVRICNSLFAMECAFPLVRKSEKASEYARLLRYSMFMRSIDLCAAHCRGMFMSRVFRLYRKRMLRFPDCLVAVGVASIAMVIGRLSVLNDHLVWGRYKEQQEYLGDRWQYKWVPLEAGRHEGKCSLPL